MAKLDEKQAFSLIQGYYNDKRSQTGILKAFLDWLGGAIDDERALQKSKLSEKELDSEAIYAVLATFDECIARGDAEGFKEAFTRKLRSGLRKFSSKRSFVDVNDVSIPDSNPNPEEAYAVKEQVELCKSFLLEYFSSVDVEWFIRHYSHGERLDAIAKDYGISAQAVFKKVRPMLIMVQQYMEKMNEG